MLSSRSRILANLNAKENLSPSRKRSSEEAFPLSNNENTSKRRTVDSFDLPQVKSRSLFSSNATQKATARKQMSIKSYYKDGAKENRPLKKEQGKKLKIFNDNKEETKKKPKEDDAFGLMCAEEAPEKYWELLAEERRKGLEFALKENKELAEEIRAKDETIKELRTEVDELKETAKHAEYLASVLEELGKGCNVSLGPEDDEEEEGGSDSEDDEGEVFDEKEISSSFPKEEESSESEETSQEDAYSAGTDDPNLTDSASDQPQDGPLSLESEPSDLENDADPTSTKTDMLQNRSVTADDECSESQENASKNPESVE